MDILTASGEDLRTEGEARIIIAPYNILDPLKPARLNLAHVEKQDDYDQSMHIMIGENLKAPKGKGLELWNSYNGYRSEISELITNYSSSDGSKVYKFKAPVIQEFKNQSELIKQLEKSIAKGEVNNDDKEVLKKIYSSLSKNERFNVGDVKDIHWLGKTFDHSPVVATIASLSSLQKEILNARADAIDLLYSKVGGGEYSFNKIIPLAYGPALVNAGDSVSVDVFMGAYDSDIQPEVMLDNQLISNVSDGIGHIELKAGSANEMNLTGTISITNKHGLKKTMPWEKKIKVMRPMATISLPQLHVLFKGHKNIIEGVASGFDKTELNGQGASLVREGNHWIATPTGNVRNCKINVIGVSSTQNRRVVLGTYDFEVRRLPPPQLYFGGTADGGQIAASETLLRAKYSPEFPLVAKFDVVDWEMDFKGNPGPSQKGKGERISSEASRMLRSLPRGTKVYFQCRYRDGSGTVGFIKADYRK
jgi:gliding motility-associated protein GldM